MSLTGMGAAKLVKGTTSSRQVVRQDVEDPQIGRLRDADLFAFLIEIRITLRRITKYSIGCTWLMSINKVVTAIIFSS